MSEYNRIERKALKLVSSLQSDIASEKRPMIENYGIKEINKFHEKNVLPSGLSYSETCKIWDILNRVSEIY